MKTTDILKAALRSIRGNLLRAMITMLIIAFGIAALVGILTAIDSAIYAMNANFSSLGSASFSIEPKEQDVDRVVRGRTAKETKEITYDEAMAFKKRFQQGRVAISHPVRRSVQASYQEESTNPVLRIIGADENDPFTRGHKMECGRFFTGSEVRSARRVAVLGAFTVEALFAGRCERAIGAKINIDGLKYTVVGVIEAKGASLNESSDKKVFIPVTQVKQRYTSSSSSFDITVGVTDMARMDEIIASSNGLMRKIRKLSARDDNDFEVTKADGIISIIKDNTVKLRGAAIAIGLITLLGAAIGLMNIMLVSVTERTKEIGVAKAVGAKRRDIVTQFLIEAILICQFGGLIGILFGTLAGFGVSAVMKGPFVVPWLWILLGILLCMLVGLASGIYPATKAARLDPIDSLRYE